MTKFDSKARSPTDRLGAIAEALEALSNRSSWITQARMMVVLRRNIERAAREAKPLAPKDAPFFVATDSPAPTTPASRLRRGARPSVRVTAID